MANQNDSYHSLALEKLNSLTEPLITTWPVITEVCHLLLKRRGVSAELNFLRSYQEGAFIIFEIKKEHWGRLVKLMEKYADLPMDLAEASLVILAEHLGEGRILSTDQRDFRAYRWKNTFPFRNLFLEP